MRTKLIAGLLTTAALASFASPALAQETLTPQQQAVANGPQIHVDTCSAKKTKQGYISATCPLYAINMGNQTVDIQYASNLPTFVPKGYTSYSAHQTATVGIPGNGKPYSKYPLKFAFKGTTLAQVQRNLKVTISNATGGATIVAAVATPQS
jgi:hypothetical protein